MPEENIQMEEHLKDRIEAVLFVAGEAVLKKDLARALAVEMPALEEALRTLRDEYDFAQRGLQLRLFGDHVQLTTRPLYAQDVVHLLQPVQKQSFSQTVMETLAVVAYKQPVTKAEIEQIRGVKCDYSVQVLCSRGMIREVGRKEALGRPILYGTTDSFLSHFGIESLADLPELPDLQGEETRPEEELPDLIP